MKSKIVTREELVLISQKLKSEGKKIAATSGCFDILHAGHVTYLEEAADRGDVMVLLLNSDSSVRGLKGDERPIVPEDERSIVVAGLGCIDYVCLFDESTPCDLISRFEPDVWVKGGDYEGKIIPEMDILEAYGGRVEYVSLVDGCSSTNIIEKIKKLV